MIGLLGFCLSTIVVPPMMPASKTSEQNIVLFCQSRSSECVVRSSAELDPARDTASVAFVDELGRLVEPTAEQLNDSTLRFEYEETWTGLEGARIERLPDGTLKASFPDGFRVHLTARTKPPADEREETP